jgi:hypothetical protein
MVLGEALDAARQFVRGDPLLLIGILSGFLLEVGQQGARCVMLRPIPIDLVQHLRGPTAKAVIQGHTEENGDGSSFTTEAQHVNRREANPSVAGRLEALQDQRHCRAHCRGGCPAIPKHGQSGSCSVTNQLLGIDEGLRHASKRFVRCQVAECSDGAERMDLVVGHRFQTSDPPCALVGVLRETAAQRPARVLPDTPITVAQQQE